MISRGSFSELIFGSNDHPIPTGVTIFIGFNSIISIFLHADYKLINEWVPHFFLLPHFYRRIRHNNYKGLHDFPS